MKAKMVVLVVVLLLVAMVPAMVMAKSQAKPENTGRVTLDTVSYTHLRAHETVLDLVCRLLLEKKKNTQTSEIKEL